MDDREALQAESEKLREYALEIARLEQELHAYMREGRLRDYVHGALGRAKWAVVFYGERAQGRLRTWGQDAKD